MLHVKFSDYKSFIEWIKEENPTGERYFCFDGETLVAVVQSARRRAVLKAKVEGSDFDKISDELGSLGFKIVEEIKFSR
ncbi:MAG: hypothetical protein NDF55_10560 [archaeon GB-1867-005]|nr:hypothetical protein [Candidatus Culexmicrobium cathedralense]